MEECRGCKSYNGPYKVGSECAYGFIYNIEDRKDCPCKKCLIKMICIEVCDDFKEYISASRRASHEKRMQRL